MKKIRVLFDAREIRPRGYTFSGISKYIRHLLLHLAAIEDIELTILAHSRGDIEITNQMSSCNISVIPRGKVYSLTTHIYTYALNELKHFSVFHAPAQVFPYLAPKTSRVLTVHDITALTNPEWYPNNDFFSRKVLAVRSLKIAHVVIANSTNTKMAIVDGLDIEPAKIHVVPLGVDTVFRPLPGDQKPLIKKRYNLPDKYIVSIGTIQPRKNILTAARSVAHLKHYKLIHIGSPGWRYDEIYLQLEKFIRKGVLELRIDASDEELLQILRCADAFLITSFHEGFGLPALEALACGVPVVSSNGGALPEILGNAALFSDPNDVETFITQLARITEDIELRNKLINEGLRIASNYTWAKTASITADIYRALAN